MTSFQQHVAHLSRHFFSLPRTTTKRNLIHRFFGSSSFRCTSSEKVAIEALLYCLDPLKERGKQKNQPTMQQDKPITKKAVTDITIYGATSFVARHVITYLVQASVHLPTQEQQKQCLKITLAGRNADKLEGLAKEWTQKMELLLTATAAGDDNDDNNEAVGRCVFDVHVADSEDVDGLRHMASRTVVVLACAGPFAKYGSNVVAACAELGTHYVDITGEMTWVAAMRAQHGQRATGSGARLVSLCGFDSVPSDLAVLAAVEALQKQVPGIHVEKATTWHAAFGMANHGTMKTMQEYPIDLGYCLRQPVPFLMEDPLLLTHPSVRSNPDSVPLKNKLARTEWWNQLIQFHSILKGGFSAPFFMATVNAKVVHASAVALKYGTNFVYQERFLPVGFRGTIQLQTFSLIPAVLTHIFLLVSIMLLRLPLIGPILLDFLGGAGTGSSDAMCSAGHAEIYAQVDGPINKATGKVDRANCFLKFKGDPGNWVTAQCISEAALTLLLVDEKVLPPRSQDGFGTPAELLGSALLKRLRISPVRKVEYATSVRKQTSRTEWRMFP